MTSQQIVGLAARIFSLWIMWTTFDRLIDVAMGQVFDESPRWGWLVAWSLGTVIPPLLASFFLWRFPMVLAYKMGPRRDEAQTLRLPVREATAAASAILGIWFLLNAFPVWVVVAGMTLVDVDLISSLVKSERLIEFSATSLKGVLGVFLLAKPWFIAQKVFPDDALAKTGSSRPPSVGG